MEGGTSPFYCDCITTGRCNAVKKPPVSFMFTLHCLLVLKEGAHENRVDSK
jgi:hypothetical protein